MKYTTIAIAIFLAASANAQWTGVSLHPAGAEDSVGVGVSGSQQVGWARVGDYRASLWTGTAGSWADLNPAGATYSIAWGVHGGQQVGWAHVGGHERAGLWTGTAGSWVGLHPAGATASRANAVGGGQQAGSALVGGLPHAGLWTGTAGSWVDLSPGEVPSIAYGVSGGQQVGLVEMVDGVIRASLWTGTAGSWVDLSPAEATWSVAYGVESGQQVGSARVGASPYNRASLWSGTAGSWVALGPAGVSSDAFGVHGGQQVGRMDYRAAVWSGTAGSRIDLHQFLPPQGFVYSAAVSITHAAGLTYIVGYGDAWTRDEAVMWVSRAVAPTSFSMFRGTVFSGNLASLINSDGNKLVLRPGVVLTSGEPPVQVRINSTAPTGSPNGISFSVESSASFPFAQQKISLWNYDTGAYELLNTRVVTTSDDTVTVTARTNAHRFIDNGTLAMRALVSYRAIGPTILYPWSARIDKVWWTFPG